MPEDMKDSLQNKRLFYGWYIVAASFFLAYLRVGGQVLNLMSDVPAEMVTVIQSIIILLITAEAFLAQWRYRITVRQAESQGEAA